MRGKNDTKPAKPHLLMVSGPVVWCNSCGAYACAAPLLLAQPCSGRPTKTTARDRCRQLARLRTGVHPETRKTLNFPIPIDEWKANVERRRNAVPTQATEQHPASPPPAIGDDGTEFTRAFIRRGRPEGTSAQVNPVDRIRAKLKRTNAVTEAELPDTKKTKVKVEHFLNDTELADTDLVDFWKAESDDEGDAISMTNEIGTVTEEQIVDLAFIILTAEYPCNEPAGASCNEPRGEASIEPHEGGSSTPGGGGASSSNEPRESDCKRRRVESSQQQQSTGKRPKPEAGKGAPSKKLRKPG